jgi:hypothetical protein
MSGELKATLVILQPLKGDEVVVALRVLGPAIDELDRVAHDAGFRLRLIVMPSAENEARDGPR